MLYSSTKAFQLNHPFQFTSIHNLKGAGDNFFIYILLELKFLLAERGDPEQDLQ